MSSRRKSSVIGTSKTSSRSKSRKIKPGSSRGTTAGNSADGRQSKVNIWPEWNENDINNEKWETGTPKGKEKEKSKSPMQAFFEDPDACVFLPPKLHAVVWRRSNEVFTKNPVVVDQEHGIHNFDIFTPNEHLLGSETIRWIISQITALWMTSEKTVGKENAADVQLPEGMVVDPHTGKYHSWRFWDHVFSLNKVGKSLPLYNSSGKYVVKLFWMNEWRKIYVDDLLPYDENDRLLLPITTRENEIWPIILTKALLKVASLSYCHIPGEPEFGDFSVIHCLTGWIQQKKMISKPYKEQVWRELNELLPKWDYPELKKGKEDPLSLSPDNIVTEATPDKIDVKENNPKEKGKKDGKDSKAKDKKEKDKSAKATVQHVEEVVTETMPLVMATFKMNYSKLAQLTASSNEDKGEMIRRNLNMINPHFTHPITLNYLRDKPLIRPITPEKVPAWKQVRPLPPQCLSNHIPKIVDEANQNETSGDCEDDINIRSIEVQSLFMVDANASRKMSAAAESDMTILGDDIEEDEVPKDELLGELDTSMNKVTEASKMSETHQAKSSIASMKPVEGATTTGAPVVPEEVDGTVAMSTSHDEADQPQKEAIQQQKNQPEQSVIKEAQKKWINITNFCDCFDALYIYHRPESFKYKEKMTEKYLMEQQDQVYIFSDHTEPTEIMFSVSCFSRWLTPSVVVNQSVDLCGTPTTLAQHPSQQQQHMATLTLPTSLSLDEHERQREDSLVSLKQQQEAKSQLLLLLVEHFSWKSLRVGRCFKRMRTGACLGISLKLPPGRHCLRVHVKAPTLSNVSGFCCRLMSKTSFSIGPEDSIIQLCTNELARVNGLANQLLNSVRNWVNSLNAPIKSPLDDNNADRILLETIIGERNIYDVCLPNYTQIMSRTLLKFIEKMNPDLLTKEILFTFRCLTLDFDMNLLQESGIVTKQGTVSNRTSAKIPPPSNTTGSKADNRKASSSKNTAPPPVETKIEEKINEFEMKEYNSQELEAVYKLQRNIRGWYVRRIAIQARQQITIFQNNVVTEETNQNKAETPGGGTSTRQGNTAETPNTPKNKQQPQSTPVQAQPISSSPDTPLAIRVTSDLSKLVNGLFGDASGTAAVGSATVANSNNATPAGGAGSPSSGSNKDATGTTNTGDGSNLKPPNLLLLNLLRDEMSRKSNQINGKRFDLDKLHELVDDRANHIGLTEFSGKSKYPPPSQSGVTMLFRDTFHVTQPFKSQLIIKLNLTSGNVPHCTMLIIDNDTGTIVHYDSITRRLFINGLQPNNNGYTFLGYVTGEDASVNWKLKIISDAQDVLPKFNAANEISSEFSVVTVKDYFIPTEAGQLFQQMVNVKENHPVSIHVHLSNPTLPLLVTVMNNEDQVCKLEGVGSVFIPNFVFEKSNIPLSDEQEDSNRSPSRTSNKSKKKSAKNSRTNSASSNDEGAAANTGILNKYSIQAFIDNSLWHMSPEDKEFIEKMKETRKHDIGENKLWSDGQAQKQSGADSSKKDTAANQKQQSAAAGKSKGKQDKQDTKGGGKGTKGGAAETNAANSRPGSCTFDEDKPHWKLAVYSDANMEDNIKIFRNNELQEQLMKMKKLWKDVDPMRFEKGKQAQMQYFEELGLIPAPSSEPQDVASTTPVEDAAVVEKRPKSGRKSKSPQGRRSTSPAAAASEPVIQVPEMDLTQFYPPEEIQKTLMDLHNTEERAKVVEKFRNMKKDWDDWCVQEKIARKKRIADTVEQCKFLQNQVGQNRLKYYRARENIRRQDLTPTAPVVSN